MNSASEIAEQYEAGNFNDEKLTGHGGKIAFVSLIVSLILRIIKNLRQKPSKSGYCS